MTFEEKKQQYLRTEILDFVTQNRIGHQDESLAFQTASMSFDKARQETLREVKQDIEDLTGIIIDNNHCETCVSMAKEIIEKLEAEK